MYIIVFDDFFKKRDFFYYCKIGSYLTHHLVIIYNQILVG